MDRLQYLKDSPAAVECPVLRHEDLSGENNLMSYKPSTVLAGIIDFEGARVVPLWYALADPPFCDLRDEEERRSLLELRHQILCHADPAFAEAKIHRPPLRLLLWLAFAGITQWCSVTEVHQTYQEMKEAWPVHEAAFADLDRLVALGPAGYTKRGHV